MDRTEFTSKASGELILIEPGAHAFVPAPLPPKLPWSAEMVSLQSQADRALGELSGTGQLLPNPLLLVTPYMRQEAIYSSGIEGTQTTLPELLRGELASRSSPPPSDDLVEVRNYVAALTLGIEHPLPFSLRLIRDVHRRLMQGARGRDKDPGHFRRVQNLIGGTTPQTARFVPPPVPQMRAALDDWERFAHAENDHVPDLARCALLHAQFETIHPFLDGNGRVGRLLIILFLMARGALSQPLLYLSAFFEAHRSEYVGRLMRVRTHGDWVGWISFFLTGLIATGQLALRQARRLIGLREELSQSVSAMPRALKLVDPLLDNPYLTSSRVCALLGVSMPTARKTVEFLARQGIIEPVTDGGRSLFVATSVLDALQIADL